MPEEQLDLNEPLVGSYRPGRKDLLALFDREQRVDIHYPGMKKETWPYLVRFTRPAPGTNFITYFRPGKRSIAPIIQEQIDYFSPFDQPFHWKVYAHDRPAGIEAQLLAHGFQSQERDMVMVYDTENPTRSLARVGYGDVRRISGRQELDDVIQVLEQVYGADFQWVHYRLGADLDLPDYLFVYVGYEGRCPVSTGWIYFPPESHFASLWGGCTIAESRGRGHYTAILRARIQAAQGKGYRYLVVDSGPMSRPIVARYGFRLLTCARTWEYERQS